METMQPHRPASRRGIAMLITLIFLAIFACMAVAITASADMNMAVSRNRLHSQQAAALAETGLQLVQRHLGGLAVQHSQTAGELHEAIAHHLETAFASSAMVSASAIQSDSESVDLPLITLTRPDGQSGQLTIHIVASGGADDNTTITVRCTGMFDNASRTVLYNMTVQRGRSVLMDYGIASKSPIQMTGNARVSGANNAAEGSVMSATYSTPQAIRMTGNCSTSGDAAVCNPNGRIVKTGNVRIGGRELIGVTEPEWPEVDISVFRPYATNTYSGNGSGNLTLSNIRIPPNTNPTFSGNITVYGVVYVQSPNKVHFSGNCNLVGVIVCETPAVDNLNANQLKFTGNLSTSGVENLPAGPPYNGLRDLTGSFILAPGYSTQFSGNFNTVNGCMVASEFKFTGNAGGRVKGGIVNLRDSTFQMTGNANLVIDREGAVQNPAGLSGSYRLVCVTGSYAE